MKMLLTAFLALCLLASPAAADPVSGVIAALGTAFKAAFTAKALGSMLVRTLLSAGFSLLMQKLQKKKSHQPGIQTSATTAGGTDPQGTILGLYATGGHLVYHNSHGVNNRYYTRVIEVSDLAGVGLKRLVIGGEYSDLDPVEHADYGRPILSKRDSAGTDHAWIKFHDGSQAAADPMLVDTYSDDEDRPWTANHKLSGIAYLILTVDYHRPSFPNGVPDIRAELTGIPLYDPRLDGSVGGVGSHRWSNPATWALSENPILMVYNIKRGITVPGGRIWGGGYKADELPLSNWIAGMNACDPDVGTPPRPKYRAGLEIRFNDEPADVIDELLAAANAQVSELGGIWRVQVGAPEASVLAITDEDILVSKSQQFDPFPGFEATFNGVSITHPSPAALWNPSSPAAIANPAWELADGRQRLFKLELPAVPYVRQARQLANALIRDERRFRRHVVTVPPDAFFLEVLNTVSWSSAWNSYSDKLFEIAEAAYDLTTLTVAISIRERDPSDFDPDLSLELPEPPRVLTPIAWVDSGVSGFNLAGVSLPDKTGDDWRPGLQMVWDKSLAETIPTLAFQARLDGETDLAWSGTTSDLDTGKTLIMPVQGNTTYQARARAILRGRTTSWGPWKSATTPDVKVAPGELSDAVWDAVSADATAIVDGFNTGVVAPEIARIDSLELEFKPLTENLLRARELAEQNLSDTLGRISESTLWLMTKIRDQEGQMRAAGLFVDEVDGSVRIAAVDALDGKVSQAEIIVDAVKSEIELRVTYGEMNQAISTALLDPTQIPIIDDLQLLINQATIDINALTNTIALKADTTTVNGMDVRLTDAEVGIDGLQGSIGLKAEASALSAALSRLTTAEALIATLDGAGISFLVQDMRQLHDATDKAAEFTLASLLQAYEERKAISADFAYGLSDIRAKVSEGDEALAQTKLELGAQIAANKALVIAETTARSDANSAMAEAMTQLEADLGGKASADALSSLTVQVGDIDGVLTSQANQITQLQADLATTNSGVAANASGLSGLSTTVTSQGAMITTQAASITQLQADLAAANGGVAANASGLSNLTTTVTSQGDTLTAQGASLTQLQADLATANGGISANASGISSLTTTVTNQGGTLTAHASSLNALSTTVGNQTTTISQHAASIDGIHGEYMLRVDANGHVAGMVLGAEAGESGATVSKVGFVADKFTIADPDGGKYSPFVVYTTDQTINGVLVPRGIYLKDAMVRNGVIGRAQIVDKLESDNYAEDADGFPTQGLKLNFATGKIKAADSILSRNIVLAQGTYDHAGTIFTGHTFDFFNSGIRMGKNDVWSVTNHTVIIQATLTTTPTVAGGTALKDVFWGFEASPMSGARWNGMGTGGAPTAAWRQDPATLVDWPNRSGDDQRLFFNATFRATKNAHAINPRIKWKIFLVT